MSDPDEAEERATDRGTDPAPVEPVPGDPEAGDQARAEPDPVEPAHDQAARAEPARGMVADGEPGHDEAVRDELLRDEGARDELGRDEHEFAVKQRTQRQLILSRFLRHRLAVASLLVFVLIVLFAFVGPLLWTLPFDRSGSDVSQPPSFAHPFGTTSDGKDNLALVMRGTQQSIKVALMIALFSTAVGTAWGAVSGFYRGLVDGVFMRLADLVLTLPLLVVAAVLAGNVGGSWWLIGLVIGGLAWAYVSRIVRGVVLSLREKEFIEAARGLGSSDTRIIFRHLVPNALGPIIVNATILVATGILTETALSFLGFGVRPPDTSLGLLVNQARTAVETRPWLFYFPGLFIIVIALSVNFIGDGLRDAFDPQQTRVRQ